MPPPARGLNRGRFVRHRLTIVSAAAAVAAVAMFAAGGIVGSAAAGRITAATTVEVCFSPRLPGGCDPRATIVRNIAAARKSILLQAYELTARPIVRALIQAHRRGVDVRAIVDRKQYEDRHYRYDARRVRELRSAGIPVLINTTRGLMHDKVMIIDDRIVLTGSYNYTYRAENENDENLLIIHNRELAAKYTSHWRQCAASARALGAAADIGDPIGPVIGNLRTHIYQWPRCPYYGKVSPGDSVDFPSAQAAARAGFRPAKNCR